MKFYQLIANTINYSIIYWEIQKANWVIMCCLSENLINYCSSISIIISYSWTFNENFSIVWISIENFSTISIALSDCWFLSFTRTQSIKKIFFYFSLVLDDGKIMLKKGARECYAFYINKNNCELLKSFYLSK